MHKNTVTDIFPTLTPERISVSPTRRLLSLLNMMLDTEPSETLHHQPELVFLLYFTSVLLGMSVSCAASLEVSKPLNGRAYISVGCVSFQCLVYSALPRGKPLGPSLGTKSGELPLPAGHTPGFVCSENTKQLHSSMAPQHKHTVLR